MDAIRIAEVMTAAPHSIGLGQSLNEAARRMREHGIRHLPVLHAGQLAGVVSERDIAIVEALAGVDPDEITVEDAMTREPYTVTPDTMLADVVRAMADHKLGCAVVMDGRAVVGLLTTTDALRILWERLTTGGTEQQMNPSQVRALIEKEHAHIRALLDEVDEIALRVIDGEKLGVPLRERGRLLYETLTRHISLEDRVLAPALRDTPGFGEVRAEQLLAHHAEQREQLAAAIERLTRPEVTLADVAREIRAFVGEVRIDMAHEDRDLLNPSLLKDDPIQVDFGG
jgi:acetoin utilization protein AcuB